VDEELRHYRCVGIAEPRDQRQVGLRDVAALGLVATLVHRKLVPHSVSFYAKFGSLYKFLFTNLVGR
jgi:hypothetical protein